MKMLTTICGAGLCVLGVAIMAATEPRVDCIEVGEVLAEAVEADQLTWLEAEQIVDRCLANNT